MPFTTRVSSSCWLSSDRVREILEDRYGLRATLVTIQLPVPPDPGLPIVAFGSIARTIHEAVVGPPLDDHLVDKDHMVDIGRPQQHMTVRVVPIGHDRHFFFPEEGDAGHARISLTELGFGEGVCAGIGHVDV